MLEKIINELYSFMELPENWDCHHAIPPTEGCIINTINLFQLIGDKKYILDCEFYPNPNGTISVDWDNIILEIGDQTITYWDNIFEYKKEYNNNNLKQLIRHINKILS